MKLYRAVALSLMFFAFRLAARWFGGRLRRYPQFTVVYVSRDDDDPVEL